MGFRRLVVAWGCVLAFLMGTVGAEAHGAAASLVQPRRDREAEVDILRARVEDLRSQLAVLRDEIRELASRLARSNDRVSALEREVNRLTAPGGAARSGAGAGAGEARDDAPPGIDDSDEPALDLPASKPLASPEAALREARTRYEDAFADLSFESKRDRETYLERIRAWIAGLNRELTDTINWTCEIHRIELPDSGPATLAVRVIDPQTHKPRSAVHLLQAPRRAAISAQRERKRAAAAADDDNDDATGDRVPFRLDGIFRMQLRLDEARVDQGRFDEPPFVGPFVSFGYQIEVRTLSPAEEP